jgi:two-component system chemotaxis response regulator CheY
VTTAPLALLADRDEDTRLMYGSYLRQLRFEIEEAEDGREALAKAISRRPAVLVTETRLPGIDGVELCKLLRADAITRSIAIVVVTADSVSSSAELAEAAGADAVLFKPCLPDHLAAEIRRVLAKPAPACRGLLRRSHARGDTRQPPAAPPELYCPVCDAPLRYVMSHVGGVSERHPEQWDYFACAACRGAFEYRHRTRRVRPSPAGIPPSRLGTSHQSE